MVLIIGILSAIAIPQYQKAVEKSKAVEALALLHTIGQAQQRYFLANGSYADSFDQLDVTLPSSYSGTSKFFEAPGIKQARSSEEWSILIYNDGSTIDVDIARLKGKYKNAGFYFMLKSPHADISNAAPIVCAEWYTSSPNAYCKKIFAGTLIKDFGAIRTYKLP